MAKKIQWNILLLTYPKFDGKGEIQTALLCWPKVRESAVLKLLPQQGAETSWNMDPDSPKIDMII